MTAKSEVLTSSAGLKQWGELWRQEATGEAFRETILGDDVNGQEIVYVPMGFHFDATVQLLPADQMNPESELTGTPIPPWNSLRREDAERVKSILLGVLQTGTTIEIIEELGMDHYEVSPKPLGFNIRTPNATYQRNCGQVARSLMHGVYLSNGEVVFDVVAATQSIVTELS